MVRRIRASGPRVLLTVLAQHVYDMVQDRQGNSAHLSPTLGPGVRPRLCHIVKDEGGFGFSVTYSEPRGSGREVKSGISAQFWAGGRWKLTCFFWFFFFRLPGYQAPFWLVLSTGGAAERAGVPPGARLLEVNGVSVEKFTYNQLSRKVWPAVFPHSGLTPLGPGAMPQAADSSPSHSSSHLTLYLLPSLHSSC